ncbi:phage portal protein [Aureliella helgolandensis]|uniref:Phage portal protein, lambda family n=1 Tax=Aureliella helgolandensis TaxID=2527968 RepID=A0A518G4B4_9BACT|nr:phage portal protein [Aureliella helgolandensis]QDV23438.1 Phage portal protein, lambda family [Aureliella helgolandensis]
MNALIHTTAAATRLVDPYGNPLRTTRERAAAEARAKFRTKLRAAYDAAQTTSENTKHWRFADDLSSAEANSLDVRRTLRSRSRYECLQSNSFAKGIVCTLANDFISTGPGLQIRLKGHEDMARRIERAFLSWARQVRLVRKLRTARLAKCVDGEAFLLASTNPRLRGPVKLDIRVVESDQISTPGWADNQLDANKVDGIHFDSWGNPELYHMLPFHPGDRRGMGNWGEPIDLDPDHVIHLFNHERPGQVRGIPEVTPALPLFAMSRRYTLATVLAAETAADFVALLHTQAGAFEDGHTPQDPFESVDIDRGMMTALPYGYDMKQLKAEQPTTTYVEFRNALLQEIARCIHMPTNKARGDSSGYNYSSARLDHQIYYHALDVERVDWEIECLDRIFEWWLDEALLVNSEFRYSLPPVEELPHRWTWKPAASVNPLQDAKTHIALIDAGLETERDYLMEQGIDPELHWEEIEAQRQRRMAANPQPTTGPAQASAQDDAPNDDANTDDAGNASVARRQPSL